MIDRDVLRLPEPDTCRSSRCRSSSAELGRVSRERSATRYDSRQHLRHQPPPQSWPASRIDSFLSEYNRQMLRVLTIHEAYPGIMSTGVCKPTPVLLRRVLGSESMPKAGRTTASR